MAEFKQMEAKVMLALQLRAAGTYASDPIGDPGTITQVEL